MQGVTPRCSMKCCLWALVKFLKALSFTGSMPNRLRIFTSRRGGLRKLRVVVMDVLNHMDVSKMMAVVTEVWVLRFQGWSQPRSSGLFLLWVSRPPEIGKLGQQEPRRSHAYGLKFPCSFGIFCFWRKPSLLFHAPRTNHSWSFQPFRKGPPEVGLQTHLTILTDPVVCPDCNMEDSLSSNMRREIAENTRIPSVFCIRIQSFQGFRVLGFGV